MLARTASWTTTGFVCVVFGALLLGTPAPNGPMNWQRLEGLVLVVVGLLLGAYVWYRNTKLDVVRRGTFARTKGT